jgi:hypothetical protein
VTPPITTHQELVLVERAFALARAEKSRITRDQEDNHVAHIETKAGREAGLDSFRRLLERLASPKRRARVASAHR